VPGDNQFVAGELIAGNVRGKGYNAGAGMTIGIAFGRIAGTRRGHRAATENEDGASRCRRLRP